jgi:hypothetical protein
MTVEIPTLEPTRFRAGDTISWSKSLSDYPASDSWVLHYRLWNQANKYDIDATADGSDHLVSVSAATSAAYKAGDYQWTSWVTLGSERYTVSAGRVTVLPDIAAITSPGYDSRTNAQKVLDLLDAAKLAHGPSAWTQEYEIAGRRMRFTSVVDFLKYYDRISADVRREKNAELMLKGGRPRNRVNVRF